MYLEDLLKIICLNILEYSNLSVLIHYNNVRLIICNIKIVDGSISSKYYVFLTKINSKCAIEFPLLFSIINIHYITYFKKQGNF